MIASSLAAPADRQDGAPLLNGLDDPAIQAAARRSIEQVAADQANRATAAARSERDASRRRYRGASDATAFDAVRGKFVQLLGRPIFRPFEPDPGQRVARYLGERSAVVTTGTGRETLIESSVPLRGRTAAGETTPLDLTLGARADGFEPASAAVRTSFPNDIRTGIRVPIGDSELKVRQVGAGGGAPARVQQDKLFYPNVATDTDLIAAALPTGTELFSVLRSVDSPEAIGLSLDGLPAGSELRDDHSGGDGAEVVRGDQRLAAISAPLAFDAQGQQVAVSMTVRGNELELSVAHRGRDLAYPIVVDPVIETFTWSGATNNDFNFWAYNFIPAAGSPAHTPGLFNSHSGTWNPGLYTVTNGQKLYHTDIGADRFQAPGDAYVYRADFNGIRHQPPPATIPMCLTAYIFNNATGTEDSSHWVECSTPHGTPGINVGMCATGGGAYPNCNPAVGTAGNEARFDYWAYGTDTRGSYQGIKYLSGAVVYIGDRNPPAVSPGTTSSGWTDNADLTATAQDAGLGLKSLAVISPTTPGWAGATRSWSCDGTRAARLSGACSQSTQTLAYSTAGLAEGQQTVRVTGTDAVNNARTQDGQVRLDRSAPSTLNLTGGTLTGQDGQPVSGVATLNFSATDQYAGVKQAKLYVDDMTTPVDTEAQPATCGTTGCPTSLSGQLTFDASAQNADGTYRYAEGSHTVKITIEDPLASAGAPAANHVKSQSFTLLVDRSGPTVDTGGDLEWAEEVPRLTTDSPGLSVAATDESESDGTPPTSGVRSIEVKFDGVDSSPATQKVEQPCETGGCSMQHDFQLATSQLGNGTHTVDVLVTDVAGNVQDQSWDFTIDRISPLPFCSEPGVDPDGCQADPPSTAAATCLPPSVATQAPGGTVLTGGQAVAQAQQSAPESVAPSQAPSAENLAIEPSVTNAPAGFASTGTVQSSILGASVASYTVGAGLSATCVAPTSTTTAQSAPQKVEDTATVYANTAPSSDTILRPVPNGVEQLNQVREAAAPEATTYRVTLQGAQYLRQLDSGAVAVIDPSVASISSLEAPYDTSADTPADASGSPPDASGHLEDPSVDDPQTAGDVAGLIPESASVSPPDSESHYDSDTRLLDIADQESDGQAVTVLTPPAATDASGTEVPSELSVTGPQTVTVTVSHRAAGYAYPVTVADKTVTTSARRRHPAAMGLANQASGQPVTSNGLEVTVTSSDSRYGANPPEGGRALRKAMKVTWTRGTMTDQSSCDEWAKKPNINDDPRGLGGPEGPPAHDSPEWNALPEDQKPKADQCRNAVAFVNQALAAHPNGSSSHLRPYITFYTKGVPNKKTFVHQVVRLWKTKPFKDNVKEWGVTNEPDIQLKAIHGAGPAYAADLFKRVFHKHKDKGLCPRCRIVAGEFAADGPYARDYMAWLHDNGNVQPHHWALHNYVDLYKYDKWPKVDGKRYPYPNVQNYIRDLKAAHVGFKKASVRISEAGVLLNRPSGLTPLDTIPASNNPDDISASAAADRRRQKQAARRFLDMRTVSPRISLVVYYQLFGDGSATGFDSAVVEPPGAAGNLNAKKFRAAYCVLTKSLDQNRLNEIGDGSNKLCPGHDHSPP